MTYAARSRRPDSRYGVTLVELLTALGVMAVLLALVVPALREARESSRRAQCLSNLRQNVSAILQYAASSDELFPLAAPMNPDARPAFVRLDFPDGSFLGVPYFDQMQFWHAAIAAATKEQADPTVFSPWFERDDHYGGASPYWTHPSDFYYPQSFMAAPSYWREGASQSTRDWRGVRTAEVRAPAAKVLLTTKVPSRTDVSGDQRNLRKGHAWAGFVDGHATKQSLAGVGNFIRNQLHRGYAAPLLTTKDGASGRDF